MKYEGDPWDFVIKNAKVKEALPFGTVLTLAATGSEMNSGSVITNWELNENVPGQARQYFRSSPYLSLKIHIRFQEIKLYLESWT